MITGESKQSVRTIRVAAAQMRAEPGQVRDNLARAAALIDEAASKGARLIALPEGAASGYAMKRGMWDMAEPLDGPIVRWLTGLSGKLGVYIGIGLVEADGEDFYNSYVLAGPDGSVAGLVRKRRTEFNIFREGGTSRVIDTPLGRIGLGICADNHYVDMPAMMQEESVDIMLMPHAWPVPLRTSKLVKDEDVREARELAKGYAGLFASLLGVPVIFVNQVGPISSGWEGVWGRLLDPEVYGYAGFSTIADSDGQVKAQMGQEGGVIVADVLLDPSRKVRVKPPNYDGWLHPGAPLMRKVILPIGIAEARLEYALSGERKRKARQASSPAR
jgi:N-carbamoylputrescine amidase